MVMLLNIFSGTYRSRYYAPDVLKPKKWKWLGKRQIGQMAVTLGLFQNSYGVTFCVKFDAIQFMQTTGEHLPHERASFVVRQGRILYSIMSLGKVTWLRSGSTQYPFCACAIQTVIHSGAMIYFTSNLI